MSKTVIKRYLAQRHRGTDGFGFYVPEKNRLTHNVREGRIMSLLRRDKDATEILFHHRFPTSTANVRTGCHPYSTKDYFENNYVVVHNGVIGYSAADKLKEEHENLGIKYVSEQENGDYNDSEALAFDLARYFEGQVDKISASGSIAFIAIKRDSGGKPIALFFGRNNGNPLRMKRTKHSITLSSEGEGEMIDTNYLYCLVYETQELTKTYMYIPASTYSYSTSGSGYTPGSYAANNACNSGWKPSDYEYSGGTTSKHKVEPTIILNDEDEMTVVERQYVNQVANEYYTQAGNYTDAVIDVETDLWRSKQEYRNIDDRVNDEEQETTITEADINRYVELEQEIALYEAVSRKLRNERDKEADTTGQVGFFPHTGGAKA